MCFSNTAEEYKVSPVIAKAMDTIFILHADHEQNASTSTVRLAGSSGANPFACIAAGVSSLWGPAHGGANQAALEMLEKIGSSNNIKKYIAKTKAGSTAINDVVIQIVNPELGFGGIGNSGMGRSNGKAGFDEFSNLRSFVDSKGMINALPLTFPPLTGFKKSLVRFISKWL